MTAKTEAPVITTIKQKLEERIPVIDVSVDGLGPWSNSTLKQLEKCPLQFFLEKGLKVKYVRETSEDNHVTFVGRAAHVWVEHLILGKNMQEGLDLAREAHYHEVTEKYWHKVTDLTDNLYTFQQKMMSFKALNPVKKIYPELKIGLDRNFKKTGFFDKNVFFRGVIDLPIALKNGDVIIMDHKYGGSAMYGLKNYKRQLNIYKVMYHFGIEKTRGVQSGIHFMAEGETKMGDYSGAEEIENVHLRELKMDLEDAVDAVVQAGKFKQNRGSHCDYCAFKTICETNKKRGDAGDLQFVVDESKQIFK